MDNILEGFKIIIQESAFVVRTFFFILFGYYVSLESLLDLEVIIISLVLLATIYLVRFVILLPTLRTSTWPELFLSPRGLITILLFFSIPEGLVGENIDLKSFHENIIPGIFLFIILGSALFMSNALIGFKKIESDKLQAESAFGKLENMSEEGENKKDDSFIDVDENNNGDEEEEEEEKENDTNKTATDSQ